MSWDWALDGPVVLLGCVCAVACAIPGTLLVVQRVGMMSEAIAHAALPGIVVAALAMRSVDLAVLLGGALAVGVVTTVAIQALRRLGTLDSGTSMGVVFTSLFALGLLLLSLYGHDMRLDPHLILFGNLNIAPFGTTTSVPFFGEVPVPTATLSVLAVVNAALMTAACKELVVTSFDPVQARLQGVPAGALTHAMLVTATVTTVAAFEAVGAILVVSMITVPAMTAARLCSRFTTTVVAACVIGCVGVFVGHAAAIGVPPLLGPLLAGEPGRAIVDTSTTGAIAVVYVGFFALAVLISPRDGVLVDAWRRRRLASAGSRPAEAPGA